MEFMFCLLDGPWVLWRLGGPSAEPGDDPEDEREHQAQGDRGPEREVKPEATALDADVAGEPPDAQPGEALRHDERDAQQHDQGAQQHERATERAETVHGSILPDTSRGCSRGSRASPSLGRPPRAPAVPASEWVTCRALSP